VLLVPGDMLGVGRGIRFGYGFDIEHTMKGLARVDEPAYLINFALRLSEQPVSNRQLVS